MESSLDCISETHQKSWIIFYFFEESKVMASIA